MTKMPNDVSTSTVAAARPRTLSTTGSLAAWRVTSAAPAASYLRTDAVRDDLRPSANHNSILTTGVVVPAPAGRGGFGVAKQAAPPRGVPR